MAASQHTVGSLLPVFVAGIQLIVRSFCCVRKWQNSLLGSLEPTHILAKEISVWVDNLVQMRQIGSTWKPTQGSSSGIPHV